MAVEEAYELAYREAVRALDHQFPYVWPHADSEFDVDPQALVGARLSGDGPDEVDLTLELIGHMARQQRANGRQLVRIVRVFRLGACLLAIQIVLTIAAGTTMV